MFKNQEVRVAIHLQKIYQLAKWNSTPKGGGRKEPAMSTKEDSLEKAAVILSVERTMIFDSINCLKISMHYVSLQKPFETERTQEACWMEHHRDTAGFLWVQDASLWSPGKPTVTRCPHRARCTAQEALLTEVHTEKNWWDSYEVVCFSSKWQKQVEEGKGHSFVIQRSSRNWVEFSINVRHIWGAGVLLSW